MAKGLRCLRWHRLEWTLSQTHSQMSTGCDLQEEEALLKRDQKEYFLSSRFHCHIIKQNMKLRTGSLGPFSSPPSSKCFHFLIASILLELQLGSTSFQPQHNLLCSFSLFVENWLSLPTIATLLPSWSRLPLTYRESLPSLYHVTIWGWCLPHLQEV